MTGVAGYNATDLIGIGLVLIVGGVWVDAARVMGVVGVFGPPVLTVGLVVFAVGMLRAAQYVTGARDTTDR